MLLFFIEKNYVKVTLVKCEMLDKIIIYRKIESNLIRKENFFYNFALESKRFVVIFYGKCTHRIYSFFYP